MNEVISIQTHRLYSKALFLSVLPSKFKKGGTKRRKRSLKMQHGYSVMGRDCLTHG